MTAPLTRQLPDNQNRIGRIGIDPCARRRPACRWDAGERRLSGVWKKSAEIVRFRRISLCVHKVAAPLCEEEKKTGIPCSRAGADVRLAMAFDKPALAVRLWCRRLPGELPAGGRLLRCSEQPAVFRQHTDFSTNISRKHLHKISRAGIKLAENFVQM